MPHLGYTAGPACDCILRIDGTPGAAVAGAPLAFEEPLRQITFAPARDRALAISEPSGNVILLDVKGGSVDQHPVPGVPAAPDRIVWSPHGDAAALYYGAGRAIRIISGLPGNPVITGRSLESEVASFAVSDNGAALIAAFSNGHAVAFAGGRSAPLIGPGNVSAVAFHPGNMRAALLTNDGLYVCEAFDENSSCRFVAGEVGGERAIIDFSSDGERVYIAELEAGVITRIDLESGAAAAASCKCGVSGFRKLAGNAVFLIETSDSPAIRVLDDDRGAQRILFVPRGSAR